MDVVNCGDVDPELTVIGGVHGDEPCGPEAIETTLSSGSALPIAARFIVANEEALEHGARYVDADLNRVMPGDPDSDLHEVRLAARLHDALGEAPVIDLHSTESFAEPFATLPVVTPATAELVRATGVDRAVAFSPPGGTSVLDCCTGIGVECGLQGTGDAAANAYDIIQAALTALGSDSVARGRDDPVLYRMTGIVEKPEPYRLLVDNFEQVEQGEVFAEAVESGEELRAGEPFYPFLMSEQGYEDILGFQAERVGPLSDAVHHSTGV